MPSEDLRARFEDILDNIERIERYTAGMDEGAFVSDTKTIDAVERCLARISEAAVKLGSEAEALCPQTPWRDIRGLGNHLRHAYSTVEPVRVWLIVEKDLDSLRTSCRQALARFDAEGR